MLDFRQPVYIQTDTSFHGFGAVLPDDCFAGSWAPWRERERSLLPVIAIPLVWWWSRYWSLTSLQYQLFGTLSSSNRYAPLGPSWTNKRICVETDNTQAMVFINKGSCKNPIPMYWLWELFWLSVRHNFHLRERHLAGINNVMRTDWVVQHYSPGSTDYNTTAADHCSKPQQHF